MTSPIRFRYIMDNKIFEEFKKLLREADFQHLIKMGAPLDEYDHEALYLYEQIKTSNSIEEIQKIIWDHFYHSFCTGTKYSPDGLKKPWAMGKKRAIEVIGTLDTYRTIAENIKKLIGE